MSEFLKRLSRFTPDGSALDRDALLFAAGRASARRGRGWMVLAGALAATQVLSLVFLLRQTDLHQQQTISVSAPIPPSEPFSSEGSAYLELRERALVSEGNLKASAAVDDLGPTEPPLHAFPSASREFLN
jgi:hypothetical protein